MLLPKKLWFYVIGEPREGDTWQLLYKTTKNLFQIFSSALRSKQLHYCCLGKVLGIDFMEHKFKESNNASRCISVSLRVLSMYCNYQSLSVCSFKPYNCTIFDWILMHSPFFFSSFLYLCLFQKKIFFFFFLQFPKIPRRMWFSVQHTYCIARKSHNDGEVSLRVKAEQSHGEIDDYYSSILHTSTE